MKTISRFCYENALRAIAEEIGRDDVRVENMGFCGPIKLEVNWASIGYVEPSDAVDFAAAINRAAMIAATHPMNGAEIAYRAR
ncbi:MAG: hypothetical protein IJW29_06240 [Clostridia bacterium]|nr:hypothetical protein [Clostridia bacterium]